MSSPVEPPEIPECAKEWSDLHDKASVPLNAFVASNRKNHKLPEENQQMEGNRRRRVLLSTRSKESAILPIAGDAGAIHGGQCSFGLKLAVVRL